MYEFGTGKDTVLVIHGGFGAEHSYMLTALRPLEKQYHFVLYDQRGSLRSPCPDSLLNVEAMIDDIEAIRKELHIQKLTILARSMGSWQASYYLQKHPDHVKRLVLCGLFQIRNFDNPLYHAWYKKNNDEFNSFFKRPAYWDEVHKLGLLSDTDKNISAKNEEPIMAYTFCRWKYISRKQVETNGGRYGNVVKLRTTTVQNRIKSGSLWLRIKKLWYVSKLKNHFRFKELYCAFFSGK